MGIVCALLLLVDRAAAAEVTQGGKTLKITMADDDDVDLSGTGPGAVDVVVNGGAAQSFSGVENISVTGSDGFNDLCIEDTVDVEGSLKVKANGGDDGIYVSGSFGKNVSVDLGDGADTHYECSSFLVVGGNYKVKAGDGDDNLHWDQDITVTKSWSIDAGSRGSEASGNDLQIHSYSYVVGGTLKIRLEREGNQFLDLDGLAVQGLSVTGGKGDDQVDITSSTWEKAKFKSIELGVP
jgi:hypothetical protein